MSPKTIRCELISWNRVHKLARRLALRVLDSGFCPDMIVSIGRGGYIPARILCDFLDIYALTSLRVEHYKKGIEQQPTARIADPLCADLSGQRVLIVDDVSDTGDTYEVAIAHVRQFHPHEIKTASLHHKVVSHYKPDFYAQKVVKWRWLIYPWAVMEDLIGFVEKMEERPKSPEELGKRLEKDYKIRISRQVLEDVLRLIDNRQSNCCEVASCRYRYKSPSEGSPTPTL